MKKKKAAKLWWTEGVAEELRWSNRVNKYWSRFMSDLNCFLTRPIVCAWETVTVRQQQWRQTFGKWWNFWQFNTPTTLRAISVSKTVSMSSVPLSCCDFDCFHYSAHARTHFFLLVFSINTYVLFYVCKHFLHLYNFLQSRIVFWYAYQNHTVMPFDVIAFRFHSKNCASSHHATMVRLCDIFFSSSHFRMHLIKTFYANGFISRDGHNVLGCGQLHDEFFIQLTLNGITLWNSIIRLYIVLFTSTSTLTHTPCAILNFNMHRVSVCVEHL